MRCPHCNMEFGVSKGGLISLSDLPNDEEQNEEKKEPPKYPVRGKAREYSKAFEIAWKSYPRGEQKFEAFAVWNVRAKEFGESELLTLILGALNWQKKEWAKEGWYRPPYFERYLKRRKWEDEPKTVRLEVQGQRDEAVRATDRKVAEYRAAADRVATPEELAELRKARG